jgi:putative ABC transport system substrate-binding protein
MRLIGLPLILAVGLVLAPLAEAQPAGRVYRIGFLGTAAASGQANRVEALRAGLRDLGDVEGKNIVIEYRWAEGKYDRLPDLVAELVALKVDVIVTSGGTPPALAAKQATTTIPIVMAGTGDAVAAGLVSSLARPGGNITGLTDFVPELMAKRLELLKEAIPRARRVAVLSNPDNPARGGTLKAMEATARSLKVELQEFEARGPTEFESVFSMMTKSRIDAVVPTQDSVLAANVRAIADLAAKKGSPRSGPRNSRKLAARLATA